MIKTVNSSVFEVDFRMDTDVTYYNRQIYTVLDLLGDIGGLFDALRALGIGFVLGYELIFGSVFE